MTGSILAPLAGGILIGLAAAVLLFFHGRIAGISGILGGALRNRQRGDLGWRLAFLVGLLAAGAVAVLLSPTQVEITIDRSLGAMALAGLLVGFGTALGSGCTSGHGVCGIARLSKRSLVATATFMAVGALTVFVVNHLLGGAV